MNAWLAVPRGWLDSAGEIARFGSRVAGLVCGTVAALGFVLAPFVGTAGVAVGLIGVVRAPLPGGRLPPPHPRRPAVGCAGR